MWMCSKYASGFSESMGMCGKMRKISLINHIMTIWEDFVKWQKHVWNRTGKEK